MNAAWFTGLQWAHPWAWGLATLPLAVEGLRLWRASRSRHDALAYADAHLHPWAIRAGSGARPVWRQGIQILVGLLLAASLAGPRLPLARTEGGPPQARHAVNVMVVLDASPGMETAGPDGVSLMERARLALQDLLSRLRGERLGLIVYGKGAGELLPCTDDMHIFTLVLQQAGPKLLQASQNAGLPGALELARHTLLRTPGSSRAVLLIAGSDPASPASASLQTQLRQQAVGLRADGIPVFSLLLLQRSWFSRAASALDAGPLDRLAQATGGSAVRLVADPWQVLYGDGLARLPSNPIPPAQLDGWRELYGIPLLCAIILTLLLAFADIGKSSRRGSALLLPVALSCILAASPRPAHAQAADKQAWSAWQAWRGGRYAQAMRLYAALPGFDARMGEGGSAYRLGAFGPALAAYRRAMLDAATDAQRAQALFNLGNAAFHIPGHLREAIDAYRASLVLVPGDSAAQRNLRLAEAQWSQEHPESAITGIRKRGPASHHDHFGADNGRPPSQMDHKPEADARVAASDQSLPAGGRLQQGELSRDSHHGLSLPPIVDLQPALRKMQLLHDHAAQLLGGLLEQDNRRAMLAVQSTP